MLLANTQKKCLNMNLCDQITEHAGVWGLGLRLELEFRFGA